MSDQRESWSRREFVSGLTLAGTAGFAGIRPARVGAESPPETTRLRLYHSPSVCVAPQYIVGELLKAEGFSEELSRSLLNLAERDGRASYPQFTARRRVPT